MVIKIRKNQVTKIFSSLKIDGIDMTPSFSKDTTQYTAHSRWRCRRIKN